MTTIVTADVASVQPGFYGSVWSSELSVALAPQSVVAAMRSNSAIYCPVHSLMQGLSVPLISSLANVPTLQSLRISGFDLPLPAESLSAGCTFPDCAAMGGCRPFYLQSVTLSTEPAMLQRDVMRSLRDVGFAGASRALSFQPPPLDLWNPALNRSDWVRTDLLCDLDISSYTLPALPFADDASGLRMPFAPPTGLLRCSSTSTQITSVDWTAARLFTSTMLAGLPSTRGVDLRLHIEALYDSVQPVPVGFFDPLSSSIPVSGSCGQSCARLASRCPYFVDGVCRLCPMGSFKRFHGQYAYCSVCPIGSFCDSAVSADSIPCGRGSYQHESGQNVCLLCPRGSSRSAGIAWPWHAAS